MKSLSVTIQMKAIEQNVNAVLFITCILSKVALSRVCERYLSAVSSFKQKLLHSSF